MSGSSVMNAVTEATKYQESLSANYERQIEQLRREKEQVVAAYTAQIQSIHEKNFNSTAEIRRDAEMTQEQLNAVRQEVQKRDTQISELHSAIDQICKNHADEILRVQKQRDAGIVALIAEGHRTMHRLHAQSLGAVELEYVLKAQILHSQETAARALLAIHATGDRAGISTKKMKQAIWEKEKFIVKLQSEMLASATKAMNSQTQLEHRCRSTEEALSELRPRAKQADVLEQKVAQLEKLLESETKRQHEEEKKGADMIARSQAHSVELMKQLKKGMEELSEAKANNAELSDINAQLRSEFTSLKEKFVQSEGYQLEQLRMLQEDRQKLLERVKELGALHNTEMSTLRDELQNTVLQHQRVNALVRKEHEQRGEEHAKMTAELESKLSEAMNRTREIEQERDEVSLAHSSLRQENQGLQSKIESLTHELQQKEQECGFIQHRLEEATEQQTVLRVELARKDDTVKQFTQNQEGSEKNVTALKRELQNARDVAQAQSLQLQELAAERDHLSATVSEKTKQVETLVNKTKEMSADAQVGLKCREVSTTLSVRTQEVAELREENTALREALLALEARFASTEVRLTHSVSEGANASTLLQKSLKKISTATELESQTANARQTLMQGACTLRRALEEQGYDIATLPLAPSASLTLPYLEQVLLDHASLCAQHLRQRGLEHQTTVGGGNMSAAMAGTSTSKTSGLGRVGTVPSATRTPLIYRSPMRD